MAGWLSSPGENEQELEMAEEARRPLLTSLRWQQPQPQGQEMPGGTRGGVSGKGPHAETPRLSEVMKFRAAAQTSVRPVTFAARRGATCSGVNAQGPVRSCAPSCAHGNLAS